MASPIESLGAARVKVIGEKEDRKYRERRAVRVLVSNAKGEIAIIHARKEDYYKVPGGGIDEGENHHVAGAREAMEEIGCKVVLEHNCIGVVEEWRDDLHQLSYGYVGKLLEDTGSTALTEEEIEAGLLPRWASIEGSIKLMKEAQPTSTLGLFIKERDLFFVEKYASMRG